MQTPEYNPKKIKKDEASNYLIDKIYAAISEIHNWYI